LSVTLGKIEVAALISGFVKHLREVHRLPRSAGQQLAAENQRSALLEYIETERYRTLFEEGRTWSLQQERAIAADLRM